VRGVTPTDVLGDPNVVAVQQIGNIAKAVCTNDHRIELNRDIACHHVNASKT
jgi:hypothetical protein